MKRNTSIAGEYPLCVQVYDWSTAGSTELSGELTVEETGKEVFGVEEYGWAWSFSIVENGEELGSESASGDTFRSFLNGLDEVYVMQVPKSEVLAAISKTPKFSKYIARLQQAYDKADREKAEQERADAKLWEQDERVVLLRDRGYSASRGDLNDDVKLATERLDLPSMQALVALGARFDAQLWPKTIGAKNLDVAEWLAGLLGVNVEIHRNVWANAYHSDTPITLAAQAGWREGAELLLRLGAETQNVISYLSHTDRRYHDVEAMLRKIGIPRS